MLKIGCTTFDEHEIVTTKKKATLFEYAGFFPVVELDTSYYYVPPISNVEKWVKQVPETFQFVMKVPKLLTGQNELPEPEVLQETAQALLASLQPMMASQRLFCLLAQFPASFKCTKNNVAYLGQLRQAFGDVPISVELRDSSWYAPQWLEKMRQFMTQEHFSLAVVDGPQKLKSMIPLDAHVTNENFTFCRFHGRNDAGWAMTGPEAKNYRTLYNYSDEELQELKAAVDHVQQKSQNVAVIFNNNSGGDAAENAQRFQKLFETTVQNVELNPRQLGLFEL